MSRVFCPALFCRGAGRVWPECVDMSLFGRFSPVSAVRFVRLFRQYYHIAFKSRTRSPQIQAKIAPKNSCPHTLEAVFITPFSPLLRPDGAVLRPLFSTVLSYCLRKSDSPSTIRAKNRTEAGYETASTELRAVWTRMARGSSFPTRSSHPGNAPENDNSCHYHGLKSKTLFRQFVLIDKMACTITPYVRT